MEKTESTFKERCAINSLPYTYEEDPMNRVCVNCTNIVPEENCNLIRHGEHICKDCFHNILGIISRSSLAVCSLAMCAGVYIRFNGKIEFLTAGDDGYLYISRKHGSHQRRVQSVTNLIVEPGRIEALGI